MTTDYELHNMFEVLNKAKKRLTNFGTTPAQRKRHQQNESNTLIAAMDRSPVVAPPKITPVVAKKPKKKIKILTPKIPKLKKPKDPKVIDGKPKVKKPKVAKHPTTKPKKVKKKPAKSLSRIDTGAGASQEGVDPFSQRARAVALPSARATGRVNTRRRTAARKLSERAKPEDTYGTRLIQNRLGVRGVSRPAKIKPKIKPKAKPKAKKVKAKVTKSVCRLWKTEINEVFNNVLDQYQNLYKQTQAFYSKYINFQYA